MFEDDEDELQAVTDYGQDVLTGVRPANKYEILAIQRHVDDLARQNTEAFPYVFDDEKARRAIQFIEKLPHVKGHWAALRGKAANIHLEGWQRFIIAMLFGWVHAETGLRKYRIAYICVPRKNGKSILAAAIGLYMLVADGEYGAEVYCGATSEKQAWEVFRPALKMVHRTPALQKRFGLSAHAKRLERDGIGRKRLPDNSIEPVMPDGSRFEPVIGKPGDGASPSCAILDEVHEHDDDVLYDTMLTGMGARLHALLLMITTAGSSINGPCYATQCDVQDMLDGKASKQNDELFGIIYTVDKEDIESGAWQTEQALIKANPNYGISVGPDFLKARIREAVTSPRKQNITKTKHLNIWVTAKAAWLNMLEWNACADPSLKMDDFAGESAALGADLSSTDDLTATVKCFRREVDGLDHYYFFGRYYCTEFKAQEIPMYSGWVHEGYLCETDGNSIDYQLIEDHVAEDAEKFVIEQCFFDPHGASHLAQRLEQQCQIEAVKVAQNYTNYSAPMRDFERLLKLGRIHHDGNPCLTWMMGNVVAKQTEDGKMMRPIKENPESKIDGAVALLTAFIKAYEPEVDDGSDQTFVEI
ncbi:MAG: terminase large subunit [Gammaproteobacteria bacterium]|nr:MAG: terminase large subunit [Gammaproteobacteria bacterium]